MNQQGYLASTTAGHSFTLFILATNKMNIPHQSHIILEPSVQMGSWEPEKLSRLPNVTQLFSASAPNPPGASSDPQHDVEGHTGSGASHLSSVTLFIHTPPHPFS